MTKFEKQTLVTLLYMFEAELEEKGIDALELELSPEKLSQVKRWVKELAAITKV